ncbi:MAG: hypothetical protein Q4C70_08770 [Planctomycetia bacterium]|nr:hypothetical protein [Planctomycetia bacterium]
MIKALIRATVRGGIFASICLVCRILILSYLAGLPRVGYVSLSAASERSNTIQHGLCFFAVIFIIATAWGLLREYRRSVSKNV